MNATELAKAFAEELTRTLTAEQMQLVNYRNAMEGAVSAICHSHDFCDANQVMLDAMGEEFEDTDEQNKGNYILDTSDTVAIIRQLTHH